MTTSPPLVTSVPSTRMVLTGSSSRIASLRLAMRSRKRAAAVDSRVAMAALSFGADWAVQMPRSAPEKLYVQPSVPSWLAPPSGCLLHEGSRHDMRRCATFLEFGSQARCLNRTRLPFSESNVRGKRAMESGVAAADRHGSGTQRRPGVRHRSGMAQMLNAYPEGVHALDKGGTSELTGFDYLQR